MVKENIVSLIPQLPIIVNFNLSKTKTMAKKPQKKPAVKAAAPKAAPPAINVGDTVKLILNDEECAELECAPGTTLNAEVMQINDSGEHLVRFNYRPGQPRTKGAFVGNKGGNITV